MRGLLDPAALDGISNQYSIVKGVQFNCWLNTSFGLKFFGCFFESFCTIEIRPQRSIQSKQREKKLNFNFESLILVQPKKKQQNTKLHTIIQNTPKGNTHHIKTMKIRWERLYPQTKKKKRKMKFYVLTCYQIIHD